MNEIVPPGIEGISFISKDLSISDGSNVPGSSKDYFREERETKIPHGVKSQLVCTKVKPLCPIDPKIIPDPMTEVAGEK